MLQSGQRSLGGFQDGKGKEKGMGQPANFVEDVAPGAGSALRAPGLKWLTPLVRRQVAQPDPFIG